MSAPRHNLPDGISEADVLALIEGELGDADASRVRKALAHDPRWAAMVNQMSGDRQRLARAPSPPPPARVMEQARRQIKAHAQHKPVRNLSELPVSQVGVANNRTGILTFLLENAWARNLAAAAGFLLATGVVVWGVLNVIRGAFDDVPIVADNTQPPPINTIDPIEPPIDIAMVGPERSDPPVVTSPDGPLGPIAPEPVVAHGTSMTGAEALELALQGRLVLRVRSHAPATALARVDNLRRTSGANVEWRLLNSSEESELRVAMDARALTDADLVIVGDAPNARPTIVRDTGALVGAFVVRVDQVPRAFDILRTVVRQRELPAEFVALNESVVRDEADATEDLFWWAENPERWAPQIDVPIVIEAAE